MTPPLSLVERKQRQARQRIIDAARELFLERGFDGVSVGDIAERAEVGRTTFFRHFGDKQEVVFANEQELLDTITAARQADSTPAPRGATEAVEQLRPIVLAPLRPGHRQPRGLRPPLPAHRAAPRAARPRRGEDAADRRQADRQAIGETVALHGHLFDGGHLDRLGEIFTPDVVYDMSAVGVGTFEGIEAIRSAALQLGPGNPVAHHVTNVVISGERNDLATALSKGLMLRGDGTLASVTHLDTLRRHDGGWRISRRVISPQRAPLGGAHLAGAGDR